jgi:ATP-dependent protease ClpP protease subunit
MQVSKFLNLAVTDDIATLEISGEIGYNVWADTYEDYKKNTSENIKAELNAIQNISQKKIKVVLESLGGDLSHALAIRSLLVNSGSEIEVYLRGANASSSTIIATASKNVANVHMDSTGLYLIHKPMSGQFGNSNDMEQMKKDLDKWEQSIRIAYKEMGVTDEVLNDLMERNGGHGEWLTYDEAVAYGFVGNKWETRKAQNYSKEIFENKNLLVPKNLITIKNTQMENESKTLLEKIWNKLSTEKVEAQSNESTPKNEVTPEEKTAIVNEVMQILEPRIIALEEAIAQMMPEEAPAENMEKEEEEEEVLNTLKAEIKALKEGIANSKETTKVVDNSKLPRWKQIQNIHNSLKN